MKLKYAAFMALLATISMLIPNKAWSKNDESLNKSLSSRPIKKKENLESIIMPGKVIQGHAKYEQDCKLCHIPFRKGFQDRLCLDCHKKVAEDVTKSTGFHGRSEVIKETMCKHCHTEHKGRKADVVRLNKDFFNHKETDFPLQDNHARLKCNACHKPKVKYRDTPSKCIKCHKKNDPHYGRLGDNCTDCHKDATWKKHSYDHNKTKFPLTYKHEKIACSACHPSQRWKKTPLDCFACHRINNIHGERYGNKCDKCHTTKDWKKTFLDHDKTKFPLKGKHSKINCDKCHHGKYLKKENPDTACYRCHKNDDDHKGKFDIKCEKCHTPKGWKKSSHDHSKTKFPLKDKHQKLKCEKCHIRPINEQKPGMSCYDCHKHDDVHKGQQKTSCEKCHNQKGWRIDIFFDHDITNFPLIGQHAIASCEECHLESTYKDTKKECLTCHKQHDKHELRLGPKCEACHNPNGWSLWQFNHDKKTKYALTGKHAGLECILCHKKPVKKEIRLTKTCISCHFKDDVHRGGYGQPCERCHTEKSFKEIKVLR